MQATAVVGFQIEENWKERFRGMTQLERLGLMRNPALSMQYVVALLETPSAELSVSREEHAEVLCRGGNKRRSHWK